MIKDSGNRTVFETGAVRDCKKGVGRCDLLPLDVVGEFLQGEAEKQVLGSLYKFQQLQKTAYLYDAINAFGQIAFDSIYDLVLEVAVHFEEGAEKYGEYNWQKGIVVHSYIDSAVRHFLKYQRGDTDERHDRAFVWNLMCCIWTLKHHPEQNDMADRCTLQED